MFIENAAYTNILSPRGATCALCLNHGFGGLNGGGNVCLSLQRSDMSIAARHVQSPRSRGAQCGIVAHRGTRRGWVTQPIGRGNLAPTIADISVTGDSILHLAPEGRHVYSTRHAPNIPKPQRGDMCSLSQSRIRRIERRRERLPFAPEERYVVLSHTVEPVGVGLPNPSSEETSPLRLRTYRSLAIRFCI